jgi:hypothetical protein
VEENALARHRPPAPAAIELTEIPTQMNPNDPGSD